MEVKIGVQNVTRELVLDSLQDGEEVEKVITKALSENEPVVALTDAKGRRLVIPTDKVGYVEIGSPTVGQVGFRS